MCLLFAGLWSKACISRSRSKFDAQGHLQSEGPFPCTSAWNWGGIFDQFVGTEKKNSACEGSWPPSGYCAYEEGLLTQTEKIPEPPPHPYTGSRHPWEGPSLNLCFGLGRASGFFYTQPEIRSHGSSNSRPEGCRRNCLTSWSSILWPICRNWQRHLIVSSEIGCLVLRPIYTMAFLIIEENWEPLYVLHYWWSGFGIKSSE